MSVNNNTKKNTLNKNSNNPVSNTSTSSIEFQRNLRFDKIRELRKIGKESFPVDSSRDYDLFTVKNFFTNNFPTNLPAEKCNLVGRIKTIRMSGKIAFFVLEDESLPQGFQLIIKKDKLPEENNPESLTFQELKDNLDEGDYIEVSGILEVSLRGEPSMTVARINILTKSLRPLPESLEYDNLEERYTNKVVDYKMNTLDSDGLSVREIVRIKAKYWQIWREEMAKEGFLSVENPIFENIPGGAETKPFKTFYNELDQDMFLRISLELPLKRLIAGGFERVYEIGRVFRNESSSPQHLQDFTSIEWYCAYTNYDWAANFVKRVYQRIVLEILGTLEQTNYYGDSINWGEWCTKEEAQSNDWELEGGWPKIPYFEAVRYFSEGKIDTEGKSAHQLVNLCKENDIDDVVVEDGMATLLDKLWKKARVNTKNPFFLILPPVELEPLAKRDTKEPHLTQRWQIVAGRAELGKAFSELNDPIDQLERFEEQQKARDNGNEEAQFMDQEYIQAMELGMPPMSGFGCSERFVSFLLGKHIRECSTFPYVRNIEKNDKKKTMLVHSVILDNQDIPNWSKLNTCSHLSASLASRLGKQLVDIQESVTKDKVVIPMNIQYAIINLTTDSKQKLFDYMREAKTKGLDFSVFTQEMQNAKNDLEVELEQSKKLLHEISILGVAIYGKKSEVEELADKYDFNK